jgi:hypothetical protein
VRQWFVLGAFHQQTHGLASHPLLVGGWWSLCAPELAETLAEPCGIQAVIWCSFERNMAFRW